jgi:hypothetical protein
METPASPPAGDWRALLLPLARAQDALARLEASTAAASPEVAEGLRARIALREASGWLAHHGVWVHPVDLALREAGLTGSYAAARLGERLPSVLPATATASGQGPTEAPEDQDVALALTFARLWRRLAESRTWRPLDDAAAFAAAMAPFAEREVGEKFVSMKAQLDETADLPPLLAAGLVARDWRKAGGEGGDRLSLAGLFAAACLWRAQAGTGDPGLTVWSAPVQALHRLALRPRAQWLAGFLACVAEAAGQAGRELARLRQARTRAAGIAATARSHVPGAAALVLRHPVITARLLGERLGLSPRAGLGLAGQLVRAGVLREATGRGAWRAWVVI